VVVETFSLAALRPVRAGSSGESTAESGTKARTQVLDLGPKQVEVKVASSASSGIASATEMYVK